VLYDRRGFGIAGPEPLSLREIVAYLDLLGIENGELRLEIAEQLVALDRAWLSARYSKTSGGERGSRNTTTDRIGTSSR
jgi:hypothetical protein